MQVDLSRALFTSNQEGFMLTMQDQPTVIHRCGRCQVILTEDELETQRYPDRFRCECCDSTRGLEAFLTYAAIHAPSNVEAGQEWVRRVEFGQIQMQDIRSMVSLGIPGFRS